MSPTEFVGGMQFKGTSMNWPTNATSPYKENVNKRRIRNIVRVYSYLLIYILYFFSPKYALESVGY